MLMQFKGILSQPSLGQPSKFIIQSKPLSTGCRAQVHSVYFVLPADMQAATPASYALIITSIIMCVKHHYYDYYY